MGRVYNVCYAVRIGRVADVVGGGRDRRGACCPQQLQPAQRERLLPGLEPS